MSIYTLRRSRIRPSLRSGYARSAGESANPGLWRGLAGAWFPALGPSGGTLRDLSGRHHHGTLTNMEVNDDWVMSEKGWVLNCDGVDEHVLLSNSSTNLIYTWVLAKTVGITMSAWIYPVDNSDSGRYTVMGGTNNESFSDMAAGGLHQFDGPGWNQTNFIWFDGGAYRTASSPSGDSLTANVWHHVVGVVDPAAALVRLYINGKESDTTATSITGGTSYDPVYFSIGRGKIGGVVKYWKQQIANVSIYQRALSHNEIYGLYCDPLAPFRLRDRQIVIEQAGAAATINRYGLHTIGTGHYQHGAGLQDLEAGML